MREPRRLNGLPEEDIPQTLEKNKFTRMKDYLLGRYDFRLNLISADIEYRKKGKKQYNVLNENDLVCELYEAGFKGVETILMALLKSNRYIEQYNPFQVYFENLPAWDGRDYIAELASYVQVKDREWFDTQFKKMLVRSVACALGVIAFNKHCFVLHGKQNDGKTTFMRFLCPPALKPYFKENLDINNKDGRLAVCQNFFINLDELAVFSRYEIRHTKALFTLDKVKERLPYDRKATNFPRTASFLASTNDDEFLTDTTGNVRWLVFKIEGIQHDNGGKNGYNQNVDIDKVWAQAYALLKQGFKFQLTKDDIEYSEKINKGYMVATVEQELIEQRFEPGTKDDHHDFFTATDILKKIEQGTKQKLLRDRVGKALSLLNFEQVAAYDADKGYSRKGYYVKYLDPNEKNPF